MRTYHTKEEAYSLLGPEDNRAYVKIGPLNVYRFDWNEKNQEGVLNFLYHIGVY